MKRLSASLITILTVLTFFATPAMAASDPIGQVKDFLGVLTSYGLYIVGGLGVLFVILGSIFYVISSGNEKHLHRAKQTILYSLIGVAIAIGATVIESLVENAAKSTLAK